LEKRFLVILSGVIFLISAFLISFLPNSPIFIAVKILLIITAFIFFYAYKNRPVLEEGTSSAVTEGQDSDDIDYSDVADEPLQINSDRDVEKIFDSFLSTVTPLIKVTLVAESVVLLLVNFTKKQFYIRFRVTDFEDQFLRENFIDLDKGLPALVFKNKSSLIENQLPDSENLVPYYSQKEAPAKSFLGVPVYYKQQVVGVLCADNSAEESFSKDDLKILTMFAQLIKLQLVSSNKLYEYETENWIGKVLYDFSKEMMQFETSDELWKFLGGFLKKVFGADRVIISKRIDETRARLSYINQSTPAIKIGYEFPLNEGIIGWVFRKNQSLMVDDFAEKENYVPRFHLQETPNPQYRSFLSVPVSNNGNVRATISLESFRSNQFKDQSKKIMETLAYQIASFLEKIDIIERLNEQNIFDANTGLGNNKALQRELDHEIKRSREFDKCFSLILFKLNLHKKEPSEGIDDKLVTEFLTFTLPLLPKSSNFFRLKSDTVAMVLAEKLLREVLPIIQNVCERVNLKKVWVDGLVEDFNINCGLVQFPEMGDNPRELIEKAHQATAKAGEKGPNTSALYERTDASAL
jgi:GAF domain-containing protein